MAPTRDFPLFPLQLVALPTELVPLHIFEDRYKEMVAHCLDEPTEFGIVCADEDGLAMSAAPARSPRSSSASTTAASTSSRAARGPFRIDRRAGRLPLPGGHRRVPRRRARRGRRRPAAGVHEAYAELVRQATDRDPDEAEIAAMSAYEMAATVEFGVEAKQQLLESRSETARLHQLLRLLRAAVGASTTWSAPRPRAVQRQGPPRARRSADPEARRPQLADFFDDVLVKTCSSLKAFGVFGEVSENEVRPAGCAPGTAGWRAGPSAARCSVSPASPADERARARRAAPCPGSPWPASCRSSRCRRR